MNKISLCLKTDKQYANCLETYDGCELQNISSLATGIDFSKLINLKIVEEGNMNELPDNLFEKLVAIQFLELNLEDETLVGNIICNNLSQIRSLDLKKLVIKTTMHGLSRVLFESVKNMK
jgi:hypothetical protein